MDEEIAHGSRSTRELFAVPLCTVSVTAIDNQNEMQYVYPVTNLIYIPLVLDNNRER